MLRHYTLADDDLEAVRTRRRPQNKFGFGLQLCALRYLGLLLGFSEQIPGPVAKFIAAQLGLNPDDLTDYAAREETRREHLAAGRKIYGFKMFNGKGARDLKVWLEQAALTARTNGDLARSFINQCRLTSTIPPGITVIERLCADALVNDERQTETSIAAQLDGATRDRLIAFLSESAEGSVSRFVLLRQFEVGQNSGAGLHYAAILVGVVFAAAG
jgi:hypothetical protein